MINVHPALLPAFPGAHPVEDQIAYGVKVGGVTVHFVDEGSTPVRSSCSRRSTFPTLASKEEVLSSCTRQNTSSCRARSG